MIDRSTRSARAAGFVGFVWLLVACQTEALAQDAAQPVPDPTMLEPGEHLERAHGAEALHRYTVDLARSSTDYLLVLEQRGLDLVLSIEDSEGRLESFNSPLMRDGEELALLVSGNEYRVTVRSEEHTGAEGGHSIALIESPAHGVERAAWELMTQAASANFEGGQDAWTAAAAAYRGAAELWATAGRRREEATALFSAAAIEFWQLYNYTESAELAQRAASLYGDPDELAVRANAEHLRAMALVELALAARESASDASESAALFAQAFELLARARETHEQLGNDYELGLVVNILGYAEHSRGSLDAAREHFERAATLFASAEEWAAELNPLSNLAAIETEAGSIATSIATFERIVEILPAGPQYDRYRAEVLYNVGAAHGLFGNIESALQAFSRALQTQIEIDDMQGRGRSLRGIGETYYIVGDLELAAQYLEQALPIARETRDGLQQEGILRLLGNIAFMSGDYATATQRHREALAIATSSVDRTYLELLLAKDLLAVGRFEEARELAAAAHETASAVGSEMLLANALHELGRAEVRTGSVDEGMEKLERAAAIYARIGLNAEHADVLHSLALSAARRGAREQAIEHGEASLAALEGLRVRLADPKLRASLAASRGEFYETQIQWLMTLAQGGQRTHEDVHGALQVSERSRARMTADLLQEAAIDLRYDADVDLERRRTDLNARLAERAHQRDMVLSESTSPHAARAALEPILAELASIENELNLLDIELRRTSERFAALSPARALSPDEMQASLDAETVLLQYALGEERSFVWAVTRDAIAAVDLPGRAEIEAAARRVFETLSTYEPGARAGRAARDLEVLAELVLLPVMEHLDRPRVVVALDGALQYIPFAALPVTSADGTRAPLLESHEVVDVLSMSTLHAQRARSRPERFERTLAVFADPVFGPTDSRFEHGAAGPAILGTPTTAESSPIAGAPAAVAGPVAGAPADLGADGLERLALTGAEAAAIAALLGPDEVFVARGFDASRANVLHGGLGDYRFVHFATHGLVDSRYPALSALAMSQFDEHGTRVQGLLRLDDIYNLELSADLVVLSACETALGRRIRGEGFVGLAQGFIYAGARSIVASLWQVPDSATAELMARFYRYMIDDGLRPADALRRAQASIARERRWQDPYFWSGFVVVGDWL